MHEEAACGRLHWQARKILNGIFLEKRIFQVEDYILTLKTSVLINVCDTCWKNNMLKYNHRI